MGSLQTDLQGLAAFPAKDAAGQLRTKSALAQCKQGCITAADAELGETEAAGRPQGATTEVHSDERGRKAPGVESPAAVRGREAGGGDRGNRAGVALAPPPVSP